MTNRLWSFAVTGVIAFLSLVALAPAQEPYYQDKTIRILVGSSAGGTFDAYSRMIARHIGRHIRGNPKLVVENVPGAGGIIAANRLYKAVKPDGLTIGNFSGGHARSQVLGIPGIEFDAPKFHWLGVPARVNAVCVLTSASGITTVEGWINSPKPLRFGATGPGSDLHDTQKDSPHKTLKDLIDASKKKSLNAAITGMGSGSHLLAMILKRKLGMNLEVVPFKGSAPAITALLGGNADFAPSDILTAQLHKEKLHPLVVFSETRLAKFPDVPTIKELGYANVDAEAAVSIQGISGPPGLPPETRNILSNALERAIKNPELVERVEKMGPNILYLSGPEFHAVAKSAFSLVEEYKDIFQEQK